VATTYVAVKYVVALRSGVATTSSFSKSAAVFARERLEARRQIKHLLDVDWW
jgi:hypothetical protein